MVERNHSEEKVTFSVTEITMSSGRKKTIRVEIDGNNVNIPVNKEVYAYWNEQFVRSNPTPLQRKRFATFMNVLREAYRLGFRDGKKAK